VTRDSLRDLFTLRAEPSPRLRRLLGALGIALVLLVWWFVTLGEEAHQRIVSPVSLPSPTEVLASIPSLFSERDLIASVFATLKRVLSGFGLAVLVGVPFGVLAGAYRVFDSLYAPLTLFGRTIPVAALIPITMVWFGIDESQKVMFIFIATVPFVLFDAARAVVDIPARYVETAQTLGASAWQVVAKVLIPLALPGIFSSLRNLFGLAFGYIMLAEIINAGAGLGFLLMNSQRLAMTEHIYAILIVICLLAYGIDRLLLWFQRGLFPYREVAE
jgi:ABC-type nitrate/sulfonate/bicarbonate transport system permease component